MRRTPHTLVNQRATLGVVALALALISVGYSRAFAEGPKPMVGGHTFVATDLVPDAFVRTYVRNSLGYTRTAEFDYPPIVIGGDTLVTLDGSLAYALLGMEYQHAIRDWIGVRVGLGLRTRLGTQASSLVNEGVNVTTGFEFGWLVRLHEGSRTALAASLDITRQTLTLIDMRQFAQDVIDGDPEPALIDNVPTVRSTAGLRFSWAASRPVGVTLLLEGSYGESPRRDEADSWEYSLGASVDLDAGALWDVPLGFALAYRQTSLPALTTSDSGSVRQTLLRIAYNGKPDFLIALDLTGVLDRENRQEDSVWAAGAVFSLRYYF